MTTLASKTLQRQPTSAPRTVDEFTCDAIVQENALLRERIVSLEADVDAYATVLKVALSRLADLTTCLREWRAANAVAIDVPWERQSNASREAATTCPSA